MTKKLIYECKTFVDDDGRAVQARFLQAWSNAGKPAPPTFILTFEAVPPGESTPKRFMTRINAQSVAEAFDQYDQAVLDAMQEYDRQREGPADDVVTHGPEEEADGQEERDENAGGSEGGPEAAGGSGTGG